MTAANYDKCLAITLDFEGGYSNDPGDPGGPTKYGITIYDVRMYLNPHATAADVKQLTLDQAKTIYREHYWKPISGDAWPVGLDLSVFDAGVNSGLGRAKPWAQLTLPKGADSKPPDQISTFGGLAEYASRLTSDKTIAAVKAYNAKRLSFLHGLRTWSIFGKGWGRRVAAIEALGVKMVMSAAQMPSARQAAQLGAEGRAADSNASNAKKSAAASATGTAASGGSSAISNGPSPETVGGDLTSKAFWWGLVALGVVLAITFVVMLVRARNQAARAAAYKAVQAGVNPPGMNGVQP